MLLNPEIVSYICLVLTMIMKKNFTLAFIFSMFLCAGVLAQGSLEFVNPQTLVTGTSADPLLEANFGVKNISSSPIDVKVERTIISEVPGSKNNICWGIYCYSSTTDVTPNEVTIIPGAVDSSFKGDYEPMGFAGATIVKYCFYDINNQSDSICIEITYDALPAGIADLNDKKAVFNIHPNPASSHVTLGYEVKGNQNTLFIRDMLGKVVKKVPLQSGQHTLPMEVSDLQPGIYFYSISGNGANHESKRLIITK